MLITYKHTFENSRGKELTPGRCDCLFYAAATVALLAIGILGARAVIPQVAVAGTFLALSLIPPMVILCRSKNAGAWSLFITLFAPLIGGLGGAALAGKISSAGISGITLALASTQICLMSSYTSKKL